MENQVILVLLVFGAFVSIAVAVGLLVRDLFFRRGTAPAGDAPQVQPMPPALETEPTRNPIRRLTRWFVRLVRQSGVDMPPEAAQLLLVLTGLLLGGILFITLEDPLAALLGFTAGLIVPTLWLMFLRARRLRTLQEQLPGALDLMVRAVRAGESLDQAITLAGDEVPNPLGLELRRAAGHLQMGMSLAAAVRLLSERVPLMELRIFATTVAVHRQTGGNLALTLERMAEVVRDRLAYRRRFRAATSGGRFAAILIACLGVFAFLYMAVWEANYLSAFFEQPLGLILLLLAVAMQLLGLLIVAMLLRVDY